MFKKNCLTDPFNSNLFCCNFTPHFEIWISVVQQSLLKVKRVKGLKFFYKELKQMSTMLNMVMTNIKQRNQREWIHNKYINTAFTSNVLKSDGVKQIEHLSKLRHLRIFWSLISTFYTNIFIKITLISHTSFIFFRIWTIIQSFVVSLWTYEDTIFSQNHSRWIKTFLFRKFSEGNTITLVWHNLNVKKHITFSSFSSLAAFFLHLCDFPAPADETRIYEWRKCFPSRLI